MNDIIVFNKRKSSVGNKTITYRIPRNNISYMRVETEPNKIVLNVYLNNNANTQVDFDYDSEEKLNEFLVNNKL